MANYAILWDIDRESSYPVGIAVERDDSVRVYLPSYYDMPAQYSDSEYVLQPDLTEREYQPGEPEYFDRILSRLSRSFAIGERGALTHADVETIVDTLLEEVRKVPARETAFESVQAPPTFTRYAKTGAVSMSSRAHSRRSHLPRVA